MHAKKAMHIFTHDAGLSICQLPKYKEGIQDIFGDKIFFFLKKNMDQEGAWVLLEMLSFNFCQSLFFFTEL